MDIAEVARRSGVPASTLRFYEDRRMLAAKADEIDVQVRRLKAMSDGLRHAAACPAPTHAECPTFQRLLRAAAAGALARRQEKAGPGRRGK